MLGHVLMTGEVMVEAMVVCQWVVVLEVSASLRVSELLLVLWWWSWLWL